MAGDKFFKKFAERTFRCPPLTPWAGINNSIKIFAMFFQRDSCKTEAGTGRGAFRLGAGMLLLAGESEETYQETRRGWLKSFEPTGYHEERLVEQVILNDWLLRRANRRMLEAEAAVDAENYEDRIERVQRYKTSAERAFYRALAAVESLRKDQLRERLIEERLTWKYDRKVASLREKMARLRRAGGENACSTGGKPAGENAYSTVDRRRRPPP
jgi:hypothetical protein